MANWDTHKITAVGSPQDIQRIAQDYKIESGKIDAETQQPVRPMEASPVSIWGRAGTLPLVAVWAFSTLRSIWRWLRFRCQRICSILTFARNIQRFILHGGTGSKWIGDAVTSTILGITAGMKIPKEISYSNPGLRHLAALPIQSQCPSWMKATLRGKLAAEAMSDDQWARHLISLGPAGWEYFLTLAQNERQHR